MFLFSFLEKHDVFILDTWTLIIFVIFILNIILFIYLFGMWLGEESNNNT